MEVLHGADRSHQLVERQFSPNHVIEYRRRPAGNVRPPGYSRIRKQHPARPRGGEPGHVREDGPGHRRRGAGHAGVRAEGGFLAAEDAAEPARPGRRGPAAGPGTPRRDRGGGPGPAAGGLRRPGRAPGRRAAHHPDLAGPLTRVTKGQAAEYQALQALARGHQVLHAALAEGWVLTKSEALQLAKWTRAIPEEYRAEAEEILVAAARAGRGPARPGRDLRGDPGPHRRARPRRRRPAPGPRPVPGHHVRRRRGHPRRPHPRMRRHGPSRAGRPVSPGGRRRPAHPARSATTTRWPKPCAASSPLTCCPSGPGSRSRPWSTSTSPSSARWTRTGSCRTSGSRSTGPGGPRHRAAASVSTGDGGAWLEGDAAREVACDAMIIPVVTGDIDPGAVEDLIALCVRYHQLRTQPHPRPRRPRPRPDTRRTRCRPRTPGRPALPAGLTGTATRHAEVTAAAADALAELEHQILGKILQVVSGPGGAASFLRRHLLGKPLAGPSLPLDVGQTDDIPLHLRRLVALRDQTCQYRRRLRPARVRLRTPPRGPPRRRRPHQPHQPQRLLLVAPSRGAARTRLDPDRPPRRHQPGHQPRRQDHPQPQPPTPPRVTTPPRTTLGCLGSRPRASPRPGALARSFAVGPE